MNRKMQIRKIPLMMLALLLTLSFVGTSLAKYTSTTPVGSVTIGAVANTLTSFVQNFAYTGGIQTFTPTVSGWYQLEVWGASGGDCALTAEDFSNKAYINDPYRHSYMSGGNGGYTKGTMWLNKGETIYVVVGGEGQSRYVSANTDALDTLGGYNGGGTAKASKQTDSSYVNHVYGGGGGATHIARATGVLSALASNQSSVLIVAGGGGGARNQPNYTVTGTSDWNNSYARYGNGGAGGGLTTDSAIGYVDHYEVSGGTTVFNHKDEYIGTPSGQTGDTTSGYTHSVFGKGSNSAGSGAGGGGWYGGRSGNERKDHVHKDTSDPYYYENYATTQGSIGPGCGGSSYIKSGAYNTSVLKGSENMPLPGGTTDVGNDGNGYARITWVSKTYVDGGVTYPVAASVPAQEPISSLMFSARPQTSITAPAVTTPVQTPVQTTPAITLNLNSVSGLSVLSASRAPLSTGSALSVTDSVVTLLLEPQSGRSLPNNVLVVIDSVMYLVPLNSTPTEHGFFASESGVLVIPASMLPAAGGEVTLIASAQ